MSAATEVLTERTLLRFATAGSVDDGKSTLVGRLLHDSKSVLTDQLEAVERVSADRGLETADLSLLVDGLRAEREQGITIDVAYRYFATAARTFVLADTPGHEQYTRNTVTGAATADVVLVLVDARVGVLRQTRRHATVAALLGVPHVVLVVNKIDLVDYDQATFDAVVADFTAYVTPLGIETVSAVPVSALLGDNVVEPGSRLPWYDGPTLLELLETAEPRPADVAPGARFPVQYVIRPRTADQPDYRGYAGRLSAGVLTPGDDVVVLPSGSPARLERIDTADGPVPEAVAGDSVVLVLDRDVDISRGDLIASAESAPEPQSTLTATVTVLADTPLAEGARLLLRYGTATVPAILGAVDHLVDVDSLTAAPAAGPLQLNDVAQVALRLATPLPLEDYRAGGGVGSFLLIAPADGATLAAGMVGDRLAVLRGDAR